MSVRMKFTILLIVVSLLPILLMTFLGIEASSNQVLKDSTFQNEFNTHTVRMAIDALIDGPADGLKQLALNSTIQTMDPQRMGHLLDETRKIYSDISMIAVDNAAGVQVAASGRKKLCDVRERDFYQAALHGKTEVISEVLTSFGERRLSIVIATPFKAQGKVAGVIQATFELQQIRKLVAARSKKDAQVYVVGRDGQLLAHPNYALLQPAARLDLRKYPYIREGLLGKHLLLKTGSFENRQVLVRGLLHRRTGWLICSEIPYAKVVRESYRRYGKVLLLALIVLIIIVLFSVDAAGRIAQPIVKLQQNAEWIAEGNLAEVPIVIASNDEIGRLAASFQKMVAYLSKNAYYDSLTGLHNRKCFWNALEQIYQEEMEANRNGAVIFLDLDNFKTINDSFGHSFGDELLKALSLRFVNHFPELLVAKFGGDEFGFLLERADFERVTEVAQNLIRLIQQPLHLQGQELLLTASLGIALYPVDGECPEELLKNVDIAMYKAKECGRKCFEFFSERLSKDSLEKLNMEIDLKKAVVNHEFITYFQPQYRMADLQLVGFEALVRWDSPKYGFLYPGIFIELAERTGIISDIGKLVFRQACMFAKAINQIGEREVCVSINISPIQLMQSDFLKAYHKIILDVGVEPEWLGIEITESTMIPFFETNNQKIKFWKDIGLKISLDDFGTGYSSLNYLRKLPVTTIKIDKSFVDDIGKDDKNLKLTEAMINIAHQLDLEVIVEGVEHCQQLDLLAELKCDYVQGYLLGKPLSEAESSQLVKSCELAGLTREDTNNGEG